MDTYILIGVLIALTFLSYNIYKRFVLNGIVKNYTVYNAILQYNMDRAYETIYKDSILIYSVEATKISDKDFSTFTKTFILLVEKLLGPKLRKEFIYLYGDYQTFTFNVADYFNRKYEDDEVRKGAVDNLMESEVEGQPQDNK